jgi:carboxyl-terminal processing protease
MSTLIKFIVAFTLAVFLISLSFTAGFVVGDRAATVSPAVPPLPTEPADDSRTLEERFSLLQEAIKLVETEYYGRDDLDANDLVYGSIKGMVEQLGDPYTSFSTPQQSTLQSEDLSGRFNGIGAVVEVKDDQLLVVSPQEGSPAERAGLRPGDHIAEVDGKPTRGLAVTDAVALIRGPKGTTVRLTIFREGLPEAWNVEIVREEITLRYVTWEMLPGDIAYLRITSFGQITPDVTKAVREIKQSNAKGLVLDLRNNPGGYLDIAVEVSSQFLDGGIVLYQQDSSGERQTYDAKNGAALTETPMVVLVNKGSASASEIVAGALQDRGRAVLVGEPTFGKGSVQKIYTLSDRSSLRVTVSRWFTPNGNAIHDRGLEPDYEVALPDGPVTDREGDTQLQKALEILNPSMQTVEPSGTPAVGSR